MSRPRKPTAHLELVGAFKKDPQRRREGEPVSDESAIPHLKLTENGRLAFDFLVETAVPGVLQKMDSAYLALTAEALGRVWYGGESVTMADLQRAGQMLVRLGMTPTERSKVVVAKKAEKNPYAKFLRHEP